MLSTKPAMASAVRRSAICMVELRLRERQAFLTSIRRAGRSTRSSGVDVHAMISGGSPIEFAMLDMLQWCGTDLDPARLHRFRQFAPEIDN